MELKEILSGGGEEKKHVFADPSVNDEVELPREVAVWLEKLNASDDITVKPERENADTRAITTYPEFNRLPSLNEIGKMYGPGRWRLSVTYYDKRYPGKGGAKTSSSPWFELAEEGYREMHEEYKRVEHSRKLKQLQKEGQEHQALFGGQSLSIREVLSFAKELSGASKGDDTMLSLVMQQNQALMTALLARQEPQRPAIDAGAILGGLATLAAAVAPVVAAFVSRPDSTKDLLPVILDQNNKSNQQLLEVVRGSHGGGGAVEKVMEQCMGVLTTTLGMKKMIETGEPVEKRGVVDRIMDGVEAMIPHLATLIAMPRPLRDPLIAHEMNRQAPGSLEVVEQVRHDDSLRIEAIRRSVWQFGRETTAQVLTVQNIPFTKEELMQFPENPNPEEGDTNDSEGGAN